MTSAQFKHNTFQWIKCAFILIRQYDLVSGVVTLLENKCCTRFGSRNLVDSVYSNELEQLNFKQSRRLIFVSTAAVVTYAKYNLFDLEEPFKNLFSVDFGT